jgi:hypothetical protein
MINDIGPSRLKLCIDIKLIGSSTIQISPIVVDYKIWEFPNKVFYICNDGYVLEKSDSIKYSIHKLYLPYCVNEKQRKQIDTYTFIDDSIRYIFVKRLRNNFEEFSKSGFFGYNPTARIMTYKNFWFIY